MTWTDADVALFVKVLAHHALVEIRCDHEAKTDTAVCNCGLVDLGVWPSVQEAKESWALHVYGALTREPDAACTQRVLAHLLSRGTA